MMSRQVSRRNDRVEAIVKRGGSFVNDRFVFLRVCLISTLASIRAST